ncbi:hypothetical protein DFH08DRAFT_809917 [Mycena albidolilacea]|uniref:Uncharacterized protein n=1 Tax=Mycena albidolilacea TaxID=1033008 RepID=A0AAD7EPD4_9AGAR|nr:hypothetical protein DFH08DRAFT_809917 [Mycena albidolilacea]
MVTINAVHNSTENVQSFMFTSLVSTQSIANDWETIENQNAASLQNVAVPKYVSYVKVGLKLGMGPEKGVGMKELYMDAFRLSEFPKIQSPCWLTSEVHSSCAVTVSAVGWQETTSLPAFGQFTPEAADMLMGLSGTINSEMEKETAGEWDEILGRSLMQKDTPLRRGRIGPQNLGHGMSRKSNLHRMLLPVSQKAFVGDSFGDCDVILERYKYFVVGCESAFAAAINCRDLGATGRYRNDLYSPHLRLLPSITTYGIAALGLSGHSGCMGYISTAQASFRNVGLTFTKSAARRRFAEIITADSVATPRLSVAHGGATRQAAPRKGLNAVNEPVGFQENGAIPGYKPLWNLKGL